MAMLLLIDESRGIYIPQEFLKRFGDQIPSELEDEKVYIQDPNNEWYWDAWGNIVSAMKLTIDGIVYTLHHDGDLWAVPEDEDYPIGI